MRITTTYKNSLLQNSTATEIAWPGTLQAVLIIAVGVISGTFFDRGIYSHSSALRGEFSRRRFWYDDVEFGRAVLSGMQRSFVFFLLIFLLGCSHHVWRSR